MVGKLFSKVQQVSKIEIVKVFSLTSISTLVRMAAGFISIKIVAVIIGPAGIALLGQLTNFSAIIMGIATGGITTGVTKYIAQYKDDVDSVKSYIGTAVTITLFFSVASGLFLVFGASILSSIILLDEKYSFVFIVFGVTLIFYAFNTLLLAIVNGYKQFNLYVKISVISTIAGLFLSLALVIPFGVNGVLLNAVTSQSLTFIFAFYIAQRSDIIRFGIDKVWNKFDKTKAKQYFRFTCMTLISAFTVPVSQLIIRGHIISHFSLQTAGWWEGLNRLSAMYLLIITSSFGVYYLPRLSELTNGKEIKREIKTAYKIVIPSLLIGLTILYFCRFIIISVLFSPEFDGMAELFLWKVVGDFLKISAWLIAYLMQAKAMTGLFITTEIVFIGIYIIMAFTLSNYLGIHGIVVAYAVNYALYLLTMWCVVYENYDQLTSDT